ncbi:MAG: hypothetical protein H6907_20700 [Hyphomicrobiales bacterium]|nr:hypothetical protein [Hyphomicrobiales bacterium]MCP5374162.1 hypothetical protein [Hyphomicrobiales bacterium]
MRLQPTRAGSVACGNAVVVERDGEFLICLKAERAGKEYVHHYAVPVDPGRAGELGMIYLDPEDALLDCGHPPCFALDAGESCPAEPGHIFENARGAFLKVVEDPKSQKMFAYVELSSGQLIRRQERGVAAVYRAWRITGLGRDGAITLEQVHGALADVTAG